MFYSSKKESSQAPFLQDLERLAVPTRLSGVYRGTVENNGDPLAQGRVQVRVPTVHGILEKGEPTPDRLFIKSEFLPWAHVVSVGGSAYDQGSQLPLPTGSQVVVEFESGNPNLPIILGCIHFHPTTKISDQKDPLNLWPEYGVATGVGSKRTPAPTVPKEYAVTQMLSPTRGVLIKSKKGHTIWYDDRDEGESIEFSDRVGQGLRVESYVSVKDNKNNDKQRGSKSVWGWSTYIDEKMEKADPPALISRVSLRERGGNEVMLETSESGEKNARLISESTSVQAQGGAKRTILGSTRKNISIEIDESGESIRIKAPTIILDGEVYITQLATFFNDAHFYRTLYSLEKAILNQTNIPVTRSSQEA